MPTSVVWLESGVMEMRAATVVILLAVCSTATEARADGLFVWRNRGIDILEPEQKAVILFEDGWEELILEVKYEGAVEDFGWVVPLPSEPEMSPADAVLFEYLSQATQEPVLRRSERGRRLHLTDGMESIVDVLKHERVGIYDATVLSAGSGRALDSWLKENDFSIPTGAPAVFQEYVDNGWVFVAMKIAVESDSTLSKQLSSGTVQPIAFRFRSTAPIYPLKISSLIPGDTDVLLYVIAKQQLVNGNCRNVEWENHVYGSLRGAAAPHGHPAVPDLKEKDGYLSKLRATFRPEEMEDVVFQPYDPAAGLRSRRNLMERAEAATHLGRTKPREGTRLLLDHLEDRLDDGPDVLSALWALGEIGDPDAIPCLLGWAERPSVDLRIEALEALARLEAREAVPLFVRGLKSDSRVEQESCYEHLIRQNDPASMSGLQAIVRSDHRRLDWSKERRPTTGMYAISALAVLGNRQAEETIERVLVDGAEVTEPAALKEAAHSKGSYNSYPAGFWTSLALIYGGRASGQWHSFAMAHDLLAGSPATRDRVFRAAAEDRKMPDAGRTILLGWLNEPAASDFATLKDVWDRAVGANSTIIDVPVEEVDAGGRRAGWFTVRYNVNACNVACAYARLGYLDGLLHLKETCPESDPTLRAEIVHAIAQSGCSGGLEAVVDYIRTEWNPMASDPEFEKRLEAWRVERGARRVSVQRGETSDLRYRQNAITNFIANTAHDDDVLKALMSDPSLNPYLRIYWMYPTHFIKGDREDLCEFALRNLEQMEEENKSDPVLVGCIEGTRSLIEKSKERFGERPLPFR